jgi:hypothetical protein
MATLGTAEFLLMILLMTSFFAENPGIARGLQGREGQDGRLRYPGERSVVREPRFEVKK